MCHFCYSLYLKYAPPHNQKVQVLNVWSAACGAMGWLIEPLEGEV